MHILHWAVVEVGGIRLAAIQNGGQGRLDLIRLFWRQDTCPRQTFAMREAGAHVNFEETTIETETSIELGKARVNSTLEPSAPKIFVRLIFHLVLRLDTEGIVPEAVCKQPVRTWIKNSHLDQNA